MCILSSPWVDGTASDTLFSRMTLEQGSTSGSTVGTQQACCQVHSSVDSSRSLKKLLSCHWMGPFMDCQWMGPFMGRTGPELWLRGAGTEPPGLFRVPQPKLRSTYLALDIFSARSLDELN